MKDIPKYDTFFKIGPITKGMSGDAVPDWSKRYYSVINPRIEAFHSEGVHFPGDTIILDYLVFNWVMDQMEVYQKITDGLQGNEAYMYEITLTCTEEALADRWYKDSLCEWRIEEWLNVSKKSLSYFSGLDTICIDTSDKTAMDIVAEIYSIVIK